MDTVRFIRLAFLSPLVVAAAAASAQTFVTNPAGAHESGGNLVKAKVSFVAGNGSLTITLWDLLNPNQITTVAQDLSDISFTLTNHDVTSSSITSSSAYFVLIDGSGTPTHSPNTATDQLGWGWIPGTTFTLEDLGFAGPANTIIGGTPGDLTAGLYSTAGGSIDGNGPHNPFAQGTATWVINMTGMTAGDTVSSATFSFGTTLGNTVPGFPDTPEPITMGIGALMLLPALRLRRKRN